MFMCPLHAILLHFRLFMVDVEFRDVLLVNLTLMPIKTEKKDIRRL